MSRHFGSSASVHHARFGGSQSEGDPGGVHRDVAAPDDHHALAGDLGVAGVGHIVEEVESGDHAGGILTRDVQRAGQRGAGGQHDGLVPLLLEFGQVGDPRIALDLDAESGQVGDVGVNDLVRQR